MNMRKFAVGAALAAAAAAAMATVSYDANGVGWVGKGDVQVPFGWNDATMQRNHAAVKFEFIISTSYVATCTFMTGEGTPGERIHDVDHKKKIDVKSVADDLDRIQKTKTAKFTGWFLRGWGTVSESGDPIPVVGGPCPGNAGHEGLWSAVVPGLSDGDNGLYATYDNVADPTKNRRAHLPITPPPAPVL